MQKLTIVSLSIGMLVTLHAEQYTIEKASPFDILTQSHESCEANATRQIELEALERYVGCKADVAQYNITMREVERLNQKVTQDSCSVESTVELASPFLDEHSYYRGSMGVICQGFDRAIEKDDASWQNFELGMFVGLSGAQSEVEMADDVSKIFVEYDSMMLVGINGAYIHKIFNSQYIGARLLVAKGFESYNDNVSTTKVRNDGTPSLLRLGAGAMWGYRYHMKTDISLGVNYLYDNLSRSYTDRTYTASVGRANAELSVGYLVIPQVKLWASVASDVSANVGVSWVFGNSTAVKHADTSSYVSIENEGEDGSEVKTSENNPDARRQQKAAKEALEGLDADTEWWLVKYLTEEYW